MKMPAIISRAFLNYPLPEVHGFSHASKGWLTWVQVLRGPALPGTSA